MFSLGNICAKLLVGSHRKKEGASAELRYCDVFDGGESLKNLAKEDERERFLLFDVLVEVEVAAVLLQKKNRQFSIVIMAEIWPLTMLEGLSHLVNGGSDCSFSQGSER